MGLMFALFGAGYVVLFIGLLQGSTDTFHTALKFIGIALMAIGTLGAAGLSMHRRQRERKQLRRQRELARH